MIKYFLFVLIILGLSGCAFGPKYNQLEVKETVIKKIKIQEELLAPCVPEKPLNKEDYLKLKLFERENYLTIYSISLLGTIKDCNIKLKKIKELSDAE